jgi:hypothetical protein
MAGVFDIDDIIHGDEVINTEDSSDDTIDIEEVRTHLLSHEARYTNK